MQQDIEISFDKRLEVIVLHASNRMAAYGVDQQVTASGGANAAAARSPDVFAHTLYNAWLWQSCELMREEHTFNLRLIVLMASNGRFQLQLDTLQLTNTALQCQLVLQRLQTIPYKIIHQRPMSQLCIKLPLRQGSKLLTWRRLQSMTRLLPF